MQGLIKIKEMDYISSILYKILKITEFKRDYDASFGKIAIILKRYNLNENPRNLRFMFTLFIQ